MRDPVIQIVDCDEQHIGVTMPLSLGGIRGLPILCETHSGLAEKQQC
jgi:hypothetical protein